MGNSHEPSQLNSNSWTIESEAKHGYCFKSFNFGVVCYTAKANWYNYKLIISSEWKNPRQKEHQERMVPINTKCKQSAQEPPSLSLIKSKSALAGIAQWIEHGLGTKGSPVWFSARAHAWIVGQVPSGGHVRGNHTSVFLSLSLSPSLKVN